MKASKHSDTAKGYWGSEKGNNNELRRRITVHHYSERWSGFFCKMEGGVWVQGDTAWSPPILQGRSLTLGTQVNLLWANAAQVLTVVGKGSEAQKEQFKIGF